MTDRQHRCYLLYGDKSPVSLVVNIDLKFRSVYSTVKLEYTH